MSAGGVTGLPAALVGAFDFLPPLPRAAVLGVACGAASMGLYALASPQRRLAELKGSVRAARAAVNAYDGDFAGAMPLLRAQIALSLKQVGLTLLPTLVAALPVILVAIGLAAVLGDASLVAGAPRWLGGWEAPFIGGAFVSSLALKLLFRIH